MHRTPWTDAHDRLMVAAKPAVPEPSAAEIERCWARLAPTVEGPGRPRRSRRARIRVGIAAGIGATVLGTSGLAAAELYTAHTGKGPVDAEDLRLGGPGEKLAVAAPDFGRVVAEETTDIPFPTAESRALALRQQVEDARGAATDEFVSTGALRAWVADAALCSWSNQWAAATRSHHETARAQAIRQIQAAGPARTAPQPSWPPHSSGSRATTGRSSGWLHGRGSPRPSSPSHSASVPERPGCASTGRARPSHRTRTSGLSSRNPSRRARSRPTSRPDSVGPEPAAWPHW